jgi:hypothetical protein
MDVIRLAGKPADHATLYAKSSPKADLAAMAADIFLEVNSSLRRITTSRLKTLRMACASSARIRLAGRLLYRLCMWRGARMLRN